MFDDFSKSKYQVRRSRSPNKDILHNLLKREEARQNLFCQRRNVSCRHMQLLIAEKNGRMKEKNV